MSIEIKSIIDKTPFKSFDYWFRYLRHGKYDVYRIADRAYIGTLTDMGEDRPASFNIQNENHPEYLVDSDFTRYKLRPEYLVSSRKMSPSYDNPASNKALYEYYLSGIVFIRYWDTYLNRIDMEDIDIIGISTVEKLLSWLDSTDFYYSPASSRYHENFAGGLLYHTLLVIRCMEDLLDSPIFDSVDAVSAGLCCCLHDWCKIGLYESYERNVKDPNTGKWYSTPAYRHKDHRFINLGHGVSSLFLAQRFFKLSMEEAATIRWHMGVWNTCESEYDELQACNEKFPMVHLIQFADQLSITDYIVK